MAVLQNMREKFGIAISVIIALSLLYFIAPMDDLMTLFGRPQNVGEISGKAVSYEDYQEEVDKFTTINQIMTGSTVQNEQTQKQIREMAWQSLMDKYLFLKHAKAAGITVGDAEMIDLTTGDNVSPIIAGNQMFADESGRFSPETLIEFVGQIDADESGRSRTYWNYLQNTVYTQQFYQKYGALFNASDYCNALMSAKDISMNNMTADIKYVCKDYPVMKDSSVVVSKSEIREFYRKHKDFFKQKASRDIEYVVFEVIPSAQDITEATESFEAAYQEFGQTDNMKSFLLKNSDRSLSNYWYKAGELNSINSDINNQIFSEGKTLTATVKAGNSLYAAKVMSSAMVSDSVYVKHILLQEAGAKAKADSLLGELAKGASFANLAAEFSADRGSMDEGVIGNIGWMTQTYMIPGFESVITAPTGKPQIINTQYGTHIVVVSKKTPAVAKKQIAILEKSIIPGKQTMNSFYADANRFSSIASGSYEGYLKAVDSLKVYSHTMNISEATERYGAIDQAKEVTRWAFEAKKGKASQIITINNTYFFIAAVKDIHKDGFVPIETVSPRIEEMLYAKKLNEKVKADVAAKIEGLGTLEEIAAALDSEVETKEGVSFSTANGAALDYALLGAASVAESDKIGGPVAGATGVYVFTVSNCENGSFYTEEDAKNYAAQKSQYGAQMIIPTMMDADGVEDNRARYF